LIFYGLASRFVGEVVEFYPSRAAAEGALEQVLGDAPELSGQLFVLPIDFDVASAPTEGPAWFVESREPCD